MLIETPCHVIVMNSAPGLNGHAQFVFGINRTPLECLRKVPAPEAVFCFHLIHITYNNKFWTCVSFGHCTCVDFL